MNELEDQMDEAERELGALMVERLAQGQAALWLNESLILALINTGVVEKDRMLEAVDLVIAAKRELALVGSEPAIATASIAQLASISASIAAAAQPREAKARPGPRARRRRLPPTRPSH